MTTTARRAQLRRDFYIKTAYMQYLEQRGVYDHITIRGAHDKRRTDDQIAVVHRNRALQHAWLNVGSIFTDPTVDLP